MTDAEKKDLDRGKRDSHTGWVSWWRGRGSFGAISRKDDINLAPLKRFSFLK
jgi:hypothetical protein